MARRNRKCLSCGTKYSYCPTCSVDKAKPTWMTEFCNEVCKELFDTATRYNIKMLTKPEAKEIIEKLELKDRSEYVDFIQKDLENILGEEKVIEEPIIEETVLPIIEEPAIVEEIAPISYKKNKKNKQKSHEVVKKEYE